MLIGFTDTFFVVCAAGVGAVAGAETGVDGTGTTSGTAIGAGCAAGVFISATQRKKLKARNTATIIDKRTIAPANIKVAGIFLCLSPYPIIFSRQAEIQNADSIPLSLFCQSNKPVDNLNTIRRD